MRKPYNILKIVLITSFVMSQGWVLKTKHISQSRGDMSNDSLKLVGSIGASISYQKAQDSISVTGGFFSVVNGVYKMPTRLLTEVNDTIKTTQESVNVQAVATDINGIRSATLNIQIGGNSNVLELPMYSINDSTYQVSVPDTLLSVRNFRSWVVTVDSLYYEAISDYDTPVLEFSENELKMDDTLSRYPDGVISNRWRMVSWPAELLNGDLKTSSLKDGYVFYDWDMQTGKWTKPDTIIIGKAYWFKHNYNDNIIFTNNNSTGRAMPLVDYELILKDKGWNIIGSPFSFPVTVEYDSLPISLYTYGYNDSTETDGWTEPTSTLIPWSGYAVYAQEAGQILTVKTFGDEVNYNRSAGRTDSEEWALNLRLKSENYLDYSGTIGRKELGQEGEDDLDVPALPTIESFIAVRMEINGNGDFHYGSDIRSLEEFNGVWNLKLVSNDISGPYTFSIMTQSDIPSGLHFSLLDIPNKNVIQNIFSETITINESLGSGYDIKIIAGDQQYVDDMIRQILEDIPNEFSLSQNYPNPFNPTTKIDFALPRSADVSITIYNLMGQKVNVLMNSNLEYGYHTVIWNGLDQFGSPVASGVYFSELRSKSFRQTKKMLLLK